MTLIIIAKPIPGSMPPATLRPLRSHWGTRATSWLRSDMLLAPRKPRMKPTIAKRITVKLEKRCHFPNLCSLRALVAISWLPEVSV